MESSVQGEASSLFQGHYFGDIEGFYVLQSQDSLTCYSFYNWREKVGGKFINPTLVELKVHIGKYRT